MSVADYNKTRSDFFADARPDWEDLAPEEQLDEICKGEQSPYYEDFVEDPFVELECPMHGPAFIGIERMCLDGHEYDENAWYHLARQLEGWPET